MSAADRIRKKYKESNIGDETIGIDYEDLYGEDPQYDDEGVESYHGVDDSSQNQSAFDVDDSAFSEDYDYDDDVSIEDLSSDEDYDPYELEENDGSSVVDIDDSNEAYTAFDSEEEEGESRKVGDTLSGMMSSASGMISRFSERSKSKKEKKPKKKSAQEEDDGFSDSAFDVSEEDNESMISKVVSRSKKTTKERIQAATDILEVLGVPETFSIDEQYYLPEDLKKIKFSYEMPKGFAPKEVLRYHNAVRRSIQHYIDLLHERNSHIVTLATEIDKKDDVIKKMQYDHEIAEGVNVMPTQGDQNLENDLTEARILISRLRAERDEALAKAEGSEEKIRDTIGLSEKEREQYSELQDEYSATIKEKDKLEKEVSKLKKNLMLLAEEYEADPADIMGFDSSPSVSDEDSGRTGGNEKFLPRF